MQMLDVPPAVPVGAMEDVMVERGRQIIDFGHTPQQDLTLPVAYIPKQARAYIEGAIDELLFGRPDHRIRARRKLIKSAALILAAIDRLDADGGEA